MQTKVARLAFNRGLISRLGLARADIKRTALSAEIQTNWMTRVLGSMMLRPGTGYLGSTKDDNTPFHIPFVFSITDKADIEITDTAMRVWVNEVVITRPAVSSAITNGNFDTNITGWNDASDPGGTVGHYNIGSFNAMYLLSNGTALAKVYQAVTVAAPDQNIEHGLAIRIYSGPVNLRVGSTLGGEEILADTALGAGDHSISVTPTNGFLYIQFNTMGDRYALVDSIQIEAAGAMEVPAPWVEANLHLLRHDQSGDVVFVACGKTTNNIGYQQRRIERHATRSWSVTLYQPEDGPFRVENESSVTLQSSVLSGNGVLTASQPMFTTDSVGTLYQMRSIGQAVSDSITTDNTFGDPIRVTGVDATRVFAINITGLTATGSTVTLQRSFDEEATWEDVAGATYTANTVTTYDDTLDNQIISYRLGIKTGDYAGGTIIVALSISVGSITGVGRVTFFSAANAVFIEVLKPFGSIVATDAWSEGQWSERSGWPTSVAFHEGRLGWSGRDATNLSISDAFDSFDAEFEGDAGPISRTIGSGPVDTINWMLSLQRLILGGQGAEFSVRASSLDEILTPSNYNPKRASTQGSNTTAAVAVDQNGVYVQRGGVRVFELAFGSSGVDYESTQLSALIPDIGSPGIVKVLVQRQPDTRLHFIRSDGTVAVMIFDKVENVICWLEVETDGEIVDGVILPGDLGDAEDFVYYDVERVINGSTKVFHEKWAFEDECKGDAQLCKLADSFVSYTGAATTTISAPHLAGEEVVVWADGADVGTDTDGTQLYTLDGSGNATLPEAVTNYVVGLAYSASWKSGMFVELMDAAGGSLLDMSRLKSLGLIMADVHAKGLKYGFSLTESEMQDLPEIENGTTVDPDLVRATYATEPFTPPHGWDVDSRLCLLAKAPRPVTILAAIGEVEHHG